MISTIPEEPKLIEFYEIPRTSIDSTQVIFAAVKDGKGGWMNVLGQWVIPPEYDPDLNGSWSEGTLVCRKGGKYGVINYKNKVIIPFDHHLQLRGFDQGLIVIKNNEGEYGRYAYFSKEGKQVCEFMNPYPEFRNGMAVTTSNRKELGMYPRSDFGAPENSFTDIYTSDFAVINTNFDTLLHIKNAPFLVEIGSLSDNRRSFIIHPNLAQHADRGIDYGLYGYLDGNGEIVIEPKFETKHALNQNQNGYTWNPDFPFVSNRSLLVEADDQYGFINTEGDKVIDLNYPNEKISTANYFNGFGYAGVRSYMPETHSSKIHVIDTTGKIVFEANESNSYIGQNGTISTSPHEDKIIPESDKKNQLFSLYTPSFEHIVSFPIKDSVYKYHYGYDYRFREADGNTFYIVQERSPLNLSSQPQKRIMSSSGNPATSWVDSKSVLSHRYGVFSHLDTIMNVATLYDFSMNELYSCSSCVFLEYDYQLTPFGIFKVYNSEDKSYTYINYEGTILSDLFNSMTEKMTSLAPQIEAHEKTEEIKLNLDESMLFDLFKKLEMSKRIIYRNK